MRKPVLKLQSEILILFGFLWLTRALSIFLDPEHLLPEYGLLYSGISISIRIMLWVSTGLVAIYAGYRKYIVTGTSVLILMPAERAFSYFVSFAGYFLDNDGVGYFPSVGWFLWWLITCVIIFRVGTFTGSPESSSKIGR